MHLLVTGAAGFIGSSLCDHLLSRGHRVTGLDNFDEFYDPGLKRSNIASALVHPSYTLITGDIRDGDCLDGIFSAGTVDAVIHLAARAGVRPSIEQPLLYEDVNVRGTLVLLEAMRRAGVGRLLFASSSSVYGDNRKVPFAETDPVDHPVSPYAATKKAGELICHTWHRLHGIRVACLRFFTVYGPRQRPEMAIHRFVRQIENGEPLVLFGDGATRRDYTYIGDIVQGIERVLSAEFAYDIVNLGESQTTTLAELVRLIESATGRTADIHRLPVQPGDVEQTWADLEHARKTYGYAPVTPVAEGIREFVRWYRSMAR